MFETLLSQNVCVYVVVICSFMGIIGRAIANGYLKSLIKDTDHMGRTRKKALVEMRKRYEDITSLDVEVQDTTAFVDKYIDRLKIGFIPLSVWNGLVKNMTVFAAGTGIFAAAYQYYVVGDGLESVKLLLCGLAACMVMRVACNMWDVSWKDRTLRDCARNYLGNSLAHRLRKSEQKLEESMPAAACSADGSADGDQVICMRKLKKRRDKTADRVVESDDDILDQMMQTILADG